jgi:CTP:molybdopterin cytidylyltransferase MocA
MSYKTATLTSASGPRRWALILASGAGQRMGGPKALMFWQGEPLALAQVSARSGDCERALVVTRTLTAEVLRRHAPDLSILISDEPDELGPAGSIAAAVRSGALAGVDQVLVTPVDVPPASGALVQALSAALGEADAARPVLDGEPGHPVLCRARLLVEAYAQQAPPLRDLLASLGSRCVSVEVQDTEVLVDFDTIEDMFARTGREPDFLR